MLDTWTRVVVSAVIAGAIGGPLGLIGYRLSQGLHAWWMMHLATRAMNKAETALADMRTGRDEALNQLRDLLERADTIQLPGVNPEELADYPIGTMILFPHIGHAHIAVRVDTTWWYASSTGGTNMDPIEASELARRLETEDAFMVYKAPEAETKLHAEMMGENL